ncbi:heparinase II/III domain-containing protein [Paenibacillus luteus]|uniref:heparinase II/III domain-containing protein n=1 Tax=Paenibacillus luteus TaxID=2545753 RepID=UPI00114181A3|nr:heparinase II/III family protein [Paenibacillus luteus]
MVQQNQVLAYAKELMNKAVAGDNPGQYPTTAIALFEEAVQRYELWVCGEASGESSSALELRNAGAALLHEVHVSERVIDEKRNELEYSAHRRELNVLVWLGETALVIDPEYYTEGAKAALGDQLLHAKSVLSGEYTVPFKRNRAFMQPRADEDIQFATEYCTMAPSYGMTTYGLKPALEWYEYQDMRKQLAESAVLPAACSTYITKAEDDFAFGGKTLVEIDDGLIAYVGFQLPEFQGRELVKARLSLTNHHIDSKKLFLHEADQRLEDIVSLTYAKAFEGANGELLLGPLVKSFHINFRDRSGYVDITEHLQKRDDSPNEVVYQLVNEAGAIPCGFYAYHHPDAEKRPSLELIYDRMDAAKLEQKMAFVREQAALLIKDSKAGAGVGQYPAAYIEAVLQALSRLEAASASFSHEEAAASIVGLYDAMRAMRHSRIYRTETEQGSSLFFPAGGIGKLAGKIENSAALQEQYGQLKRLADEMSLADIQALDELLAEKPDMDLLNERYRLWSESPMLIFTPPSDTVAATLAFVLPASEYGEDGALGHVWIDAVKLSPANAVDIRIDNAGFEEGDALPKSWKPIARSGNPSMSWENRPNYYKEGSRSLYINNPLQGDEGSWVYDHELLISGGIRHTLTFFAKIDGKLKSGIHAVLTFKNSKGETVGTYTGIHNKKSMLGQGSVLGSLRFQADAMVYAITGEREYAEKAKTMMLWGLNDFCQGVESWLRTNLRPDGIDAYGAVQGGRLAVVLATAYSLIQDAGVFSEEEHELLLARVNYLIRDLIDLRDRTELGDYAAQADTGNWHTDMSAGAAMLALVFPTLPGSRQWFENGRTVLKGQLDHHLNEDGSWPETIRYLYEVVMRYSIFAKALRNMSGENWFHGTKLAKAFEFMVSVQTPPYRYFDDKIGSPNFGDHILGDGYEFAPLGIYTDEVAVESPEWAGRLVQTWKRAGSPFAAFGTERNVLENFFAPVDVDIPIGKPLELSSQWFQGQGLTLFRHRFGKVDEGLVSLLANESALGHGHLDQGSFIFYAGGIPLVMDPGVESYFDSTFEWYKGSASHSTLQFRNAGQYSDTPLTSRLAGFYTSDAYDYARIVIANPDGPGIHTRHAAYVKEGLGALVIWDQISAAVDGTVIHLPIASARPSVIERERILSKGHYDVDLETVVVWPKQLSVKQEWGRSKAMMPTVEGAYQLEYIRIEAERNEGHLVLLLPQRSGESMTARPLDTEISGVHAFQLLIGKEQYIGAACQGTEGLTAKFALPVEQHVLKDLQTDETISVVDGTAIVTLESGELRLFRVNG